MNYRQKDLRFQSTNVYEDIIRTVFELVMLQDNDNLREAGGYLAGECYVRLFTSENEDDRALLEKLLMEIVYMPSSFVSSGCA